jgi:hypothetical protein
MYHCGQCERWKYGNRQIAFRPAEFVAIIMSASLSLALKSPEFLKLKTVNNNVWGWPCTLAIYYGGTVHQLGQGERFSGQNVGFDYGETVSFPSNVVAWVRGPCFSVARGGLWVLLVVMAVLMFLASCWVSPCSLLMLIFRFIRFIVPSSDFYQVDIVTIACLDRLTFWTSGVKSTCAVHLSGSPSEHLRNRTCVARSILWKVVERLEPEGCRSTSTWKSSSSKVCGCRPDAVAWTHQAQ